MAGGGEGQWVGTMADAYERWLVPTVFRPFAADLAARVARHPRPPAAVLELAAGTGVLTAELTSRLPPGCDLVASDVSEAMVALGRQRASAATWRTADASALPFDDEAFDIVVAQFGVMFFPDRRAAFAEARRVLRPDGRLVLSAWGRLEDHALQDAVVAGLARAGLDVPFFVEVVHGYDDRRVIVDDLEVAGFDAPSLDVVTIQSPPAAAADLAAGYCLGTPALAAIHDDDRRTAVISTVADELTARLGPDPVRGRMTALVIDAAPRPAA